MRKSCPLPASRYILQDPGLSPGPWASSGLLPPQNKPIQQRLRRHVRTVTASAPAANCPVLQGTLLQPCSDQQGDGYPETSGTSGTHQRFSI